jgi:hypothetical protein
MYINLEIEKRLFVAWRYTGIFAITFQNWKIDVEKIKENKLRKFFYTFHIEKNANRQISCAVTYARGIPMFAMKSIKYVRLFTLDLYRNTIVKHTFHSRNIPLFIHS